MTAEIKRVALYVLAEDPEPRLTEMRRMAAERGWEVVAEYVDAIKPEHRLGDKEVELQAGPRFEACQEADHRGAHDATLFWAGNLGSPAARPRLFVNQHLQASAPLEDDALAVLHEAQDRK